MKRYIKYDNSNFGSFVDVIQKENLPGDPYNLPLTSVGDGTGEDNLTGNYLTPTDFFYAPDPGEVFVWTSFSVQISDNSKFIQTGYGGINSQLVNGIKFFVSFEGFEIPLLGGKGIKRNSDWFAVTHEVNLTSWDALAQTLVVHFNLVTSYASSIIFDSRRDAKLIVRLQDDFTSLVDHRFAAKGRLYTI